MVMNQRNDLITFNIESTPVHVPHCSLVGSLLGPVKKVLAVPAAKVFSATISVPASAYSDFVIDIIKRKKN